MNNSINFFKELEQRHLQKKTKVKKKKSSVPLILLILLLVIGMAGTVGLLWYRNEQLSDSIDVIEAYVNDPQVLSEYALVNEKLDKLRTMNDYSEKIEIMSELFNTYPIFSEKSIAAIWALKDKDVLIQSFGFTEDSISLLCTSESREGPSNYADALSRSPLFDDVEYTGFATTETGLYSFNITCRVKGGSTDAAQ